MRLFKKIDGIAKRIPKHKLFKRYEEEDIPRFVLFDCGSTEDQAAENVCKQIVGQNIPNILIFRPAQQPRTLPNDLKSDKDIITYLYNLMQPAVKYLDELIEAEDFVADDSELHTLLFSKNTDMDAIRVYDQVWFFIYMIYIEICMHHLHINIRSVTHCVIMDILDVLEIQKLLNRLIWMNHNYQLY